MSVKDFDFLNEWSAEWMPRDAKKRLETSYTVYKIVDENNNIVDVTSYIERYLDILHQRWQERCDSLKLIQKKCLSKRPLSFASSSYHKREKTDYFA